MLAFPLNQQSRRATGGMADHDDVDPIGGGAMSALVKYVLIAIAIVVAYTVISPSSIGGWVLYLVIGAVAAGAIEAAFRRSSR